MSHEYASVGLLETVELLKVGNVELTREPYFEMGVT